MKKWITVMSACLIFPLLAGCASLYNPYPKNTVMVKKLEATEQPILQDDALLSEETLKTLGINAIYNYFDQKLDKDNVEFKTRNLPYEDIKKMLMSETSHLNLNQDILDAYIEHLNKASSGLSLVQITNLFNQYDFYGIMINPINGDILGAVTGNDSAYDKSSDQHVDVDDQKLIQIAKQFVEEKELATTPIDPSLIKIYQTRNEMSELYYATEDKKVLFYWRINRANHKVVDFSKDFIAAMQIVQFDSRLLTK
jgi:hypothetical protein